MSKVSLGKEFFKGIWEQNPIFKQVLGMCPTLAVTVSAIKGIAMALATTFVLIFSSFIISMIRKFIPTQVRIASYIVIIATFVTIVDLVMKAQFPDLSKALGPFIPLIVVNCLILGRQEAFASKNTVFRSLLDAIGMGLGFLLALFMLSSVREIIGTGKFFDIQVLPDAYTPWLVMILPAGAFLTLGLLLAIINQNAIKAKRSKKDKLITEYLKVKEAVKAQNVSTEEAA